MENRLLYGRQAKNQISGSYPERQAPIRKKGPHPGRQAPIPEDRLLSGRQAPITEDRLLNRQDKHGRTAVHYAAHSHVSLSSGIGACL